MACRFPKYQFAQDRMGPGEVAKKALGPGLASGGERYLNCLLHLHLFLPPSGHMFP